MEGSAAGSVGTPTAHRVISPGPPNSIAGIVSVLIIQAHCTGDTCICIFTPLEGECHS